MVNFCKPKAEFRNGKLIFNQMVKNWLTTDRNTL